MVSGVSGPSNSYGDGGGLSGDRHCNAAWLVGLLGFHVLVTVIAMLGLIWGLLGFHVLVTVMVMSDRYQLVTMLTSGDLLYSAAPVGH